MKEEGLRLVSGGTDNHLLLIDVRPLKITGAIAETALEKVGITVNKNTIPFDPEKPTVTSGIRIGTPAVTTRGFTTEDMKEIGKIMAMVLKHVDNETVLKEAREKVAALNKKYPLYE